MKRYRYEVVTNIDAKAVMYFTNCEEVAEAWARLMLATSVRFGNKCRRVYIKDVDTGNASPIDITEKEVEKIKSMSESAWMCKRSDLDHDVAHAIINNGIRVK